MKVIKPTELDIVLNENELKTFAAAEALVNDVVITMRKHQCNECVAKEYDEEFSVCLDTFLKLRVTLQTLQHITKIQ